MLGTCCEHVRNDVLIDVACRAWDISVGHYIVTLSGTCQEHVRNAVLIDVMCRAWDINVSHYIWSIQLHLALALVDGVLGASL